MDPDRLYADPDPQNLMNADPDSGQLITKLISKYLLKSKKKLIFWSEPKPLRLALIGKKSRVASDIRPFLISGIRPDIRFRLPDIRPE